MARTTIQNYVWQVDRTSDEGASISIFWGQSCLELLSSELAGLMYGWQIQYGAGRLQTSPSRRSLA